MSAFVGVVQPLTYHGPGWKLDIATGEVDEDGDEIIDSYAIWAPSDLFLDHPCTHRTKVRDDWQAGGPYDFEKGPTLGAVLAAAAFPAEVTSAFIDVITAAQP
jgi:hypothetical protein